MQSKTFETEVGGKKMVAEFTDLAEQASGSVILRYGNTAVLATAVMGDKSRDDIDYFPLTVDYEERFYAAGQILGSRFVRREGRPSEDAILAGRVVDRTIRPLFPQHLRNEVQVVITILALDEEDPAVVAVNAASLALAVSNIPWNGPVAAVRIGKVGTFAEKSLSPAADTFVINPTYVQRASLEFDLLACGKDETINMIEVGAKETSEATVAAGFARAAEEHTKLIAWQQEIVQQVGVAKLSAAAPEIPPALTTLYDSEFASKMTAAVFCGLPSKKSIYALKKEFLNRVGESEELAAYKKLADQLFEDKADQEIHRGAIEDNKRADNRAFDQVRPLFAKAGGLAHTPWVRHLLSRRYARLYRTYFGWPRGLTSSRLNGRARCRKALYASLQLPSIFLGRNRAHGWHQPPRCRPRRTCRKSTPGSYSKQRSVSVHHTPCV